MSPPQAVIFDLDDTLYDHLYSARHGLVCLSKRYPAMAEVAVRELEDRYSEALESVHVRLLSGELTQSAARILRMRQLFSSFGHSVDDEQALAEYRQFRRDYDSVCQMVAGSRALLDRFAEQGTRLAVMTNNLVSEQIAKLRQLDLDQYFEVVAISEEVGVAKPAPQIYHETLRRFELGVDDVVMVGDSLVSDIAGAVNVGMRCVWLNRRPDRGSAAPSGVAEIKNDFTELDGAFQKIINWP